MKLPHWLRCRWSRWTAVEALESKKSSTLIGSGVVSTVTGTVFRQTRTCETCGKAQFRRVRL